MELMDTIKHPEMDNTARTLILSLTQEEIGALIDRVDIDEDYGNEEFPVDPYILKLKLGSAFLDAVKGEIRELYVAFTEAETWILSQKVLVTEIGPLGERFGLEFLTKVYSALIEFNTEHFNWDELNGTLRAGCTGQDTGEDSREDTGQDSGEETSYTLTAAATTNPNTGPYTQTGTGENLPYTKGAGSQTYR